MPWPWSSRNPLTGLSGLQPTPATTPEDDLAAILGRNPLTGLSGLQRGHSACTRVMTRCGRNPLTGLSGLQPNIVGWAKVADRDFVAIPLRG